MAISVVQLVGPICVDPEDGKRLYDAIHSYLTPGSEVEVDFSGVTTLTSSFLNQAIGRLYGDHAPAEVDRIVRLTGLDEGDRRLIALVRTNAIRFYGASPEERARLSAPTEEDLEH